MIQKKVCMVGAFAVGKTSLVARYVHSIFSDRYLTTVGVKIDKKVVRHAGTDLMLLIWDIAGEDEFQALRISYLRGASGILYVADGTRHSTVDTVFAMRNRVQAELGDLPAVLAVNKHDLQDDWEIPGDVVPALQARGWTTILTSALTGEGVEECFHALAGELIEP